MSSVISDDRSDSSPPNYRTEFQQLLADITKDRESGAVRLFDRYEPFVRRLAARYLDSDIQPKVSGSDIVQTSVFEAYQGLADFAGTTDREFRGWLSRIVVNNILNQYRFWAAERRSADRFSHPISTEATAELADDQPTPHTKASQSEEESLLLEIMQQLSPEHQKVIEFRNRDGLSFQEIGVRMKRSEDAARMLWARAMRTLVAKLKHSKG